MKFMRRPDLNPQTRIQLVMTAWLHQGVYGKMIIANFVRYPAPFSINYFGQPAVGNAV